MIERIKATINDIPEISNHILPYVMFNVSAKNAIVTLPIIHMNSRNNITIYAPTNPLINSNTDFIQSLYSMPQYISAYKPHTWQNILWHTLK